MLCAAWGDLGQWGISIEGCCAGVATTNCAIGRIALLQLPLLWCDVECWLTPREPSGASLSYMRARLVMPLGDAAW